ncbi:MAG: SDR family NAD(P)-dependent oxidoreductase, partial [Kofleriaceae bacterium]|nr:SDR family NAD(P)-dependent oxidoreductase [Kofleriaceae bacterium]
MSSTVVITGASQGIGAAIAHEFAKQLNDKGEASFRLALVSRNAQSLKRVSQECRQLGGEAEYFPCDLTQEDQVNSMAQDVRDSLGVPELLINNAGQFVRANLLSMNLQSFRATIDANLTSAFLVTRAFVQSMMARKRGTIFYMASVASE